MRGVHCPSDTVVTHRGQAAHLRARTFVGQRCKAERSAGKIRCLEQLVLQPLSCENYSQFRVAVCRQPGVDKTLAICFSCRVEQATLEGITEGLRSYINDLRSQAERILAP